MIAKSSDKDSSASGPIQDTLEQFKAEQYVFVVSRQILPSSPLIFLRYLYSLETDWLP